MRGGRGEEGREEKGREGQWKEVKVTGGQGRRERES